MSYYVKTDTPDFTDKLVETLKKRGMVESKIFPVTFCFVSGEPGYYRNRVDTKKSQWISKLYGKSIERLTNKVVLHSRMKGKPYIMDSLILTPASLSTLSTMKWTTPKILKPLGGFAGSGILIVQTTDQIKEWVSLHPEYKEWILQEYITQPALKDGYKFHLRVIVVIKISGKMIEAYVGKIKFYVKAEEKYKNEDWLNPTIHDTHYKPGPIEIFPQSLPDGWSEKDGETADSQINMIVKDLLKTETEFRPDWNAKNGFEVFGIDIMFDKKKPIVLEFNNKIGLKGRSSYAPAIVNLILDGEDPMFTAL